MSMLDLQSWRRSGTESVISRSRESAPMLLRAANSARLGRCQPRGELGLRGGSTAILGLRVVRRALRGDVETVDTGKRGSIGYR